MRLKTWLTSLCISDATRDVFAETGIELQVQNLTDFLVQRNGGSAYYSSRAGFMNIPEKHSHLKIDERVAERWLEHMEEALEESRDDFKEAQRDQLLDYMRYMAYFILTYNNHRETFIQRASKF